MEDKFANVVRDEHMSDIANAIRAILGPDSGMTILDMPVKILEIKSLVVDVVNELVDALCWDGECADATRADVVQALKWEV